MSAGRVRVNGRVVTEMGAKVDPRTDVVEVDGRRVGLAERPVHLALNKPRSVMTTMRDPEGRVTVAQYVPVDRFPGLFPVGRLDYDTTGLLLFTTDGELAHRLLHPRHKVPKTYRALCDGHISAEALQALEHGIELDDGMTAPARVTVIERVGPRSVVELTITEGRKRQVRRMLAAVGNPVIELERVSFGPVSLCGLAPGHWRELDEHEVEALRAAVGSDERVG